MGKKLSGMERVERAILRDWNKQMLPFVERHRNERLETERGYYGGMDYRRSGIEFRNLRDVFMKAYFSEENECEFTYGRKINPFGDGHESNNFGGKIVTSLKDCFDAENFDVAFGDQPFLTTGVLPGIGFYGRGDAKMFDSYIKLVAMTESFVDLSLKRVEQIRERPYKYVLQEDEKRMGLSFFQKVKSAEDLIGVRRVFSFARDPEFNGSCFSRSEKQVADICHRFGGQVVSVEDFLKGK